MVEALLEYVSDINIMPDSGYGTILHHVAFKGYTTLLKIIFERYNDDVYLQDCHHRTLLHVAAMGGHLETILYLIHQGLDPFSKDDTGKDILCWAALGGNSSVVDTVLMNKWVSLSYEGKWNPIHWACRNGIRPAQGNINEGGWRGSNCFDQTKTIERLIDVGLVCETVTVESLSGQ
ncbi:ankyrin [Byssothecium circinans]|uniref:Ankyrin n=1 Tax=Byssothecium circinans TaxID=147558 RepID=A0A6A5TBX8_9PLEO|nr:ankyrin [Byssothecium circinans]